MLREQHTAHKARTMSVRLTPPDLDVTKRTVSIDGVCGGNEETSCLDSEFGDCCSSDGWCGSNSTYCALGCQGDFGICYTPISTTPISTAPLLPTLLAITTAAGKGFTSPKASNLTKNAIVAIIISTVLVAGLLAGLLIWLIRRSSGFQKHKAMQRLDENNPSNELGCRRWNTTEIEDAELRAQAAGTNEVDVKKKTQNLGDRIDAGYDGAFRGT